MAIIQYQIDTVIQSAKQKFRKYHLLRNKSSTKIPMTNLITRLASYFHWSQVCFSKIL